MKQAQNLLHKEKHSFPAWLLERDIKERKEYFKEYAFYHEKLETAINRTLRFVTSTVSERIVFVCGPSGVGKKVLINAVKDRLTESAQEKLVKNPGCIPVVDVEAVAPPHGSFDFPELWKSMLKKMNEPMLDHKISYDNLI